MLNKHANTRSWLTWLMLLTLLVLVTGGRNSHAQSSDMQSIGYWKPFVITAEKDPQVARAQRVFNNLLRAWDSTRVEPNLHVVKSSQGPWAASLADGNILLSRAAIDIARAQGESQADHLLAFVLAHELVHQRADDLWHHKFFRLVGSQAPENASELLKGLTQDNHALPDLERREAQADHDGLILMATVGYDPFAVVDRESFFTLWVENVWAGPCNRGGQSWAGETACAQAQTRAARTRAQLAAVATQATLFELGVQAFAAGHWTEARRYFIAYGREYPTRAVHNNIGLTHMAEALAVRNQLQSSAKTNKPQFFFPLLIETRPEATAVQDRALTRSSDNNRLQQQFQQHVTLATQSFERALRLEPQHKGTYLLLGLAHLLEANTHMARGVIQGKYEPRFGESSETALLLAMTKALEGDLSGAEKDFETLLTKLESGLAKQTTWPSDLFIYTAFQNAVIVSEANGTSASATTLWKRAAQLAKRSGYALLFQLAVERVRPGIISQKTPSLATTIMDARLGDPVTTTTEANSFWLEGEKFNIYRFANGARWVVNNKNHLVKAWQTGGQAKLGTTLTLGDAADRPIKALGLPSRRIELVSGVYLAYDNLGLAIHIEDDRVSGWFLYNPDG